VGQKRECVGMILLKKREGFERHYFYLSNSNHLSDQSKCILVLLNTTNLPYTRSICDLSSQSIASKFLQRKKCRQMDLTLAIQPAVACIWAGRSFWRNQAGDWLAASPPPRVSACMQRVIGWLGRRPGLAPRVQPYRPGQARGKRRNRPFLAGLARGSQTLAY
jgi:hypothetical protein